MTALSSLKQEPTSQADRDTPYPSDRISLTVVCSNDKLDTTYLISMNQHHKCVALARRVLLSLQKVSDQLRCVGDEEVEVPENRRNFTASIQMQQGLWRTENSALSPGGSRGPGDLPQN